MPEEVVADGQGSGDVYEVVTLEDALALAEGVAGDAAGAAADAAAEKVAGQVAEQVGTLDVGTVALDAEQYAWLRGSMQWSLLVQVLGALLLGMVLGAVVARQLTGGWR